jgi:signal transduction histidine kinase
MAAPQKIKLDPPAPAPEASVASPNRILIVDDEFTTRDLCKEFLETDGYDVETSDNPKKALALLSLKKFDLILSDLSMPGLNGIEFVKQVKYHYPGVNVIIMTAFGSVVTAVESMKAGAYDYITKPFPRDLLRATIKRCLESHNLKREISKMQNELFKKDKLAAVGSMAGAIAHRMRNPLSIIQMCAQYLGSRLTENKEYMEILAAIEEKVKTLERLTRDFVEYSRSSRIRKSPEQLDKLADEVIKSCAPRCTFQGVEIVRRYQTPVPPIPVDADLIREVITNILDNGLEAMKGPGKVYVSINVNPTQSFVHMALMNTGSSLSDELQDKIFEPFFTTKETGMGLGLAIVKQVIDGHGGKIQAVGDPKTNTTTFNIFLPVNPPAVKEA